MRGNHDVIIIGGGAAGAVTAMQILRMDPTLQVAIVEKNESQLARGVAYGKHFTHQPLNVRVKGMSADPDDPDHFENWLTENQTHYPYFEFDRNTFVARSIYGDYLEDIFDTFRTKFEGKLTLIFEGAVALQNGPEGFSLKLSDGSELKAPKLVLATGNFLPKKIPVQTNGGDDRIFTNPWDEHLFDNIYPSNDIFIVGSGLTAVDIILGLHARNHEGMIHLLSRNGYLPLPHKDPVKHFFSDPASILSGDIYKVFSSIREEVRRLSEANTEWQDVMDSLRGFTAHAWGNLTDEGKTIFFKKLKPYWEIHRHRIPARSLNLIQRLKAKGKLIHHKGNLKNATFSAGQFKIDFSDKGKINSVHSHFVINATGPDTDFTAQGDVFYNQLFKEQILTTDKFHLGLNITPEGQLLNPQGGKYENFYCLGTIRKGILWETTAMSEVRSQAKEVAQFITAK